MALRLIGIDPDTGGGNCPVVWIDDDKQELVLQGWKADDDTAARTQQDSPLPESEAVIRLPYRMIGTVRKALDAAEGS